MKYKIAFLFLVVFGFLFANSFPKPKGWVNDYANKLDVSTERTLTNWITELKEQTDSELSIAIVKTINGLSIEEYSQKLYEKWGIGDKNSNGCLLVIAPNERKIRIEVGYGSEGYVTDARAGDVIRELGRYLKKGYYTKGVKVATAMILQLYANEFDVVLDGSSDYFEENGYSTNNSRKRKKSSGGLPIKAIIIIILIIATRGKIIFWMLLSGGNNRNYRGGGFGGFGGGSSGGGSGFGGFGGFGGGSSGGGGASGSF